MDNFRAWCKTNEPVFRFVEVACIVIAVVWVSDTQLRIAKRQTEVAEKALQVAEAESKLVEKQTELQSLNNTPFFDFDHPGADIHYSNPFFSITTKHGEIRGLKGDGDLFLLLNGGDASKERRILIDNFYEPFRTFPTESQIYSSFSINLVNPDFLGYKPDKLPNLGATEAEAFVGRGQFQMSDYKTMPFQVLTYVKLSYWTPSREEMTEHYQMDFPNHFVRPIAKEPKWDATIDLAKYRKGEHQWDCNTIHEEIVKAVVKFKIETNNE